MDVSNRLQHHQSNELDSAILYTNGIKSVEIRYRQGSIKRHNVLEGELVAIILGLHLARNIVGVHIRINISINNQATIKTMRNNRPQSAQYLIDEIKQNIAKLHEEEMLRRNPSAVNLPKLEISRTCVAGHMDSIGNEEADKLAKAAASFGSELLPRVLQQDLPTSLSVIKQQINDTLKNVMVETLQTLRKDQVHRPLPTFRFIPQIHQRPQPQTNNSADTTQNRSQNPQWAPFQDQKADSRYCPHCPNITEDVNHLLFRCKKYAPHRQLLVTAVKRKAHDISYVLSNPAGIIHTLNFVNRTERFKHIYGDISHGTK